MPNYDVYNELTVEKKDGVGLVTLNRPDHLNAFSSILHREVEDVMVDISLDGDIKAVVLTGAGRAFSAGGDLEYMKNRDKREASNDVMIGPKRLIHSILTVKQPIITALNGDAVGVGCTVALFTDVVIMADGARIGDPHVSIGLVAGDGGSVIMPLLVGLNKAKEILLTGDLVDAKEALRIGLVNRVVSQGQALEEAMVLARKLANGPSLAIQWTKLAVNKLLFQATESVLDASLALEGMSIASQDHMEGINAFLEKRKPNFIGK